MTLCSAHDSSSITNGRIPMDQRSQQDKGLEYEVATEVGKPMQSDD